MYLPSSCLFLKSVSKTVCTCLCLSPDFHVPAFLCLFLKSV
uniref:Uncharacterized protein n=1 Tax=Anguilla anguilla TaxID=7936 RepID=A0A0E9SGG0_ANGAN